MAVELKTEQLHCSVLSLITLEVLAIVACPVAQIEEIDTVQQLLSKKGYRSTSVTISNKYYTLIPDEFWDSNHARSFLNLNYSIDENLQVGNDRLFHIGARGCFAFPQELINQWLSRFIDAKLFHVNSSWLTSCSRYCKDEKMFIGANFDTKHFFLVIFKNKKLLFSNTFEFLTKEDALYYILHAIKEYVPEEKDRSLHVSGIISKELIELVEKYLVIADSSNLSEVTLAPDLLGKEHIDQNIALLNQYLCE